MNLEKKASKIKNSDNWNFTGTATHDRMIHDIIHRSD
jgi:hypothetical protein